MTNPFAGSKKLNQKWRVQRWDAKDKIKSEVRGNRWGCWCGGPALTEEADRKRGHPKDQGSEEQ